MILDLVIFNDTLLSLRASKLEGVAGLPWGNLPNLTSFTLGCCHDFHLFASKFILFTLSLPTSTPYIQTMTCSFTFSSHMIPFILSYLFPFSLLSYLLLVISDKTANLIYCITILGLRRLGILLPYNYLLLSPSTHLKGLPQNSNKINLLRRL